MVAACNVPEDLLLNMSTQELVDLLLDYPLLGDLMLFSDINEGISVMKQNSNVLSELLSREDGASLLLEAYSDFKPIKETKLINEIVNKAKDDNNEIMDIIEDEKYDDVLEEMTDSISENLFLEAILAQEDVMKQLNSTELNNLREVAAETVEEKAESPIYASIATTIYDVAEETNCVDVLGNIPIEVDSVEENDCVRANTDVATVYTPNKTPVKVTTEDYYGDIHSLFDTVAMLADYPDVKVVANANNQYNCHSYAWYKQSTSNKYWMNDPSAYWKDGSYSSTSTKRAGERIVYFNNKTSSGKKVNPIHSGIIYSINGSTVKVKSKWGRAPLVIHKKNYSPYGKICSYYK